jgi:hypothetical protein
MYCPSQTLLFCIVQRSHHITTLTIIVSKCTARHKHCCFVLSRGHNTTQHITNTLITVNNTQTKSTKPQKTQRHQPVHWYVSKLSVFWHNSCNKECINKPLGVLETTHTVLLLFLTAAHNTLYVKSMQTIQNKYTTNHFFDISRVLSSVSTNRPTFHKLQTQLHHIHTSTRQQKVTIQKVGPKILCRIWEGTFYTPENAPP